MKYVPYKEVLLRVDGKPAPPKVRNLGEKEEENAQRGGGEIHQSIETNTC